MMHRKGDSHSSEIPYTGSLREKLTLSWNLFHNNLNFKGIFEKATEPKKKIIAFRLAYTLSMNE